MLFSNTPTLSTNLPTKPENALYTKTPKVNPTSYGSFRKLGVPYFGVLTIRILLFRVLYWGPPFSETPIWTQGKL